MSVYGCMTSWNGCLGSKAGTQMVAHWCMLSGWMGEGGLVRGLWREEMGVKCVRNYSALPSFLFFWFG